MIEAEIYNIYSENCQKGKQEGNKRERLVETEKQRKKIAKESLGRKK